MHSDNYCVKEVSITTKLLSKSRSVKKVWTADPQCKEQPGGNNNCGEPKSWAVDKAVVKEALIEILNKIPGMKDLLSKPPGTLEAMAQQTGQEAVKQSAVKSKCLV